MVTATATATRPALETVWAWLEEVPDPEIPVISLVDLGVIRDMSWDADTLRLKITPTYSGCPATAVINLDIENQLRSKGIEKLSLEKQLAPPWTTDWISETGREKLRAYGIAPPPRGGQASYGALQGRIVECPRCRSTDTERISEFGSTPCKASYRCKACLEPFDYFKCI